MVSEVQTLRREVEARQNRLLQERFAFGSGERASAISALLRHSALTRPAGSSSHFARLLPAGSRLGCRVSGFSNGPPPPNRKIIGRHLLDHEALTCLLVLLFVEEPRLNTGRLHKVLRNLCYHDETRSWLISALISILCRTSGQNSDGSCAVPYLENASHGETSNSRVERTENNSESPCTLDEYLLTQGNASSITKTLKQQSWLSFGVHTSLGSRTNVFCIKRQGKAGLERSTHVAIHPQASPFVCRHVLDALLFLAKSFPASFSPFQAKPHPSCSKEGSGTCEEKIPGASASQESSDFWEILLKLDTAGMGRKGKSAAKTSSAQSLSTPSEETSVEKLRNFSSAPIGLLLTALAHPVVQDSVAVTDKLLRLLSVTSAALPDTLRASSRTSETSETTLTETEQSGARSEQAGEETVTLQTPSVTSVTVTGCEENVTTHHVTVHTPGSETESVASSLVAERSSDAGGESHEVESLEEWSHPTSEAPSLPARADPLPHPGTVEPMIVEVTSPGDQDSQAPGDGNSLLTASAPTTLKEMVEEKTPVVMESHLRLVVNVLTSGMCSEEGLEDATTLLLQVSRLNPQTRDSVLQLLLEGARRIGEVLQRNIAALLSELIEHNRNSPPKEDGETSKGN